MALECPGICLKFFLHFDYQYVSCTMWYACLIGLLANRTSLVAATKETKYSCWPCHVNYQQGMLLISKCFTRRLCCVVLFRLLYFMWFWGERVHCGRLHVAYFWQCKPTDFFRFLSSFLKIFFFLLYWIKCIIDYDACKKCLCTDIFDLSLYFCFPS